MAKKWGNTLNSITQLDNQDKIKPIPVKIVCFDLADIMRAMNCSNEFQFWGRLLSFLHKNVFEHPEDLFSVEYREIAEVHLKQIEKKIIRRTNSEENTADDLLGVFFHCRIKHNIPIMQPWIELYPQVIAYFSFVLGVSADSLATVVLTHELAHAYSLAGYDLNCSRGKLLCTYVPKDMAEGIAQYYTHAVCEQLEHSYSGLSKAFDELLDGQRKPYKIFKGWLKPDSLNHEAVRSVWIKYRENPTNYGNEQDFKTEVLTYNQKTNAGRLWP